MSLRTLLLVAACALAACTPPTSGPVPAPAAYPTPDELARGAKSSPLLPPVPAVTGALTPRVVYPVANALIRARDSTFIFGSIGNGTASLTINGMPVHVWPNGAFLGFLPLPADTVAPRWDLVATLGADTARLTVPIRYPQPPPRVDTVTADTVLADTLRAKTDSARRDSLLRAGEGLLQARDTMPRWVVLGAGITSLDSIPADTDRVVVGRPIRGGTYKWFLLPGTVVRQVERFADYVRVRLDEQLDVWVNAEDAVPLDSVPPPPMAIASNARVVPAAGWVDLVIPLGVRPAYFVEQAGSDLVLTLYNTKATTDIIAYRDNDPFVRTVEWEQQASDRARFTVRLRGEPFGYLVFWENGNLVLRVRRRPAVVASAPLRGMVIAVDPGHPPIGATGPTGLWEPQATLWVGERVERMLRERGATVVMTRTTMGPVELGFRPVIARRADAHALVSIHLNALPDGVNPFRAHGTGTYFFRAHAEPLARAVQRGMVARMGLPNHGVFYDNLALTRPTWMPSILCEGAFLMMPDQEAALRTPEFQEAYARGIVDGLEAWFRSLADDAR
ncbi:MAG TPA: N-acetylmuramoyl-L-alanine amidase [Gemmatimonadaceae bacterium]|nr:N-acetylmuramoyl-L-alanine amidase [Gemmatimonadaceae bacterium]